MTFLPLPPHYRPQQARDYHHAPDATRLLEAAADWRVQHRLTPSASDPRDVQLLLIDVQKDFCFPQGSLFVGGRGGEGALDDTQRISEFIYRNLGQLTRITATLDSHVAQQIFFPSFWQDAGGTPLSAHRELVAEDLRQGRAQPDPALTRWMRGGEPVDLVAEALHYCESLERGGKHRLYLWPPHCLLGSPGHALVGVVQEAQLFHAFVRSTQAWVELKGSDPLTESYSALGPEVPLGVTGVPLGQPNPRLARSLLDSDRLIVAGQASSHCVKSTLEDLRTLARARGAAWCQRVYLLTDCMSAVAVPDGNGGFVTDFTDVAERALTALEHAGMHRVRSTQPPETWPGWSEPLTA